MTILELITYALIGIALGILIGYLLFFKVCRWLGRKISDRNNHNSIE